MEYPLPPWLSPSAAQGYGALYGEAQRAALSAQLARERMAQESAQAGMEAQARKEALAQQMQFRQQALQQEQMRQDQRIAIDQAYKEAEVGLRENALDTANRRLQMQADTAAKRFAATQNFQKAILPAEQGGEGLNPQQAALKYMAPYMTGDQVGRLSTAPGDFKIGAPLNIPGVPGKSAIETSRGHYRIIDVPSTVTNMPDAVPVKGDDGTIGYWVTPPGGGKPHWQVAPKTTGLAEMVNEYKKQKGVAPAAAPARKAEGGYKVGAVYKGGLRYLGGDPKDEQSWEKVK